MSLLQLGGRVRLPSVVCAAAAPSARNPSNASRQPRRGTEADSAPGARRLFSSSRSRRQQDDYDDEDSDDEFIDRRRSRRESGGRFSTFMTQEANEGAAAWDALADRFGGRGRHEAPQGDREEEDRQEGTSGRSFRGEGRYGRDREEQGQYGRGREEQGRYGRGREEQGRYGRGREEEGRYGRAREEEGRVSQEEQEGAGDDARGRVRRTRAFPRASDRPGREVRAGREEGEDREGGRRVLGRGDGPRAGGRQAAAAAVIASAASAAAAARSGADEAAAPASASTPASTPAAKPSPLPVVRPNDGDKGTFFDSQTFKQAGASNEVLAALRELGISRPSHIQAESYRMLLSPDRDTHHVALMDQAGSGKTLAYLLPLLQQLKDEEAKQGKGPLAQPGQPRLVVLAPTTELVQQVYRVAKALSGAGLRFRSACMTGGHEDRDDRSKSWRTQASQLKGGLDLLVATPGRVVSHLNAGTLSLASCTNIVLDEVDVLLGDQAAFRDQVEPLKAAAPASLRFVLVTATLPQHTLAQLRLDFPNLALASGPGLHRTAVGLEEELIDCSGGDVISLEAGIERKLEALMKVLAKRGAARVIVFCNKIESCRDVENHLRRSDGSDKKYRVAVYHEAIRADLRTEALSTFLQPVKPGELPVVLVATDRMSRGIDTMYCEHVVLFDFPRDPSEYVRRVGRTARGAGGRGTVSVLVMGRQVPLAKDIMEKNQKGKPIHRLPEDL